MPHLFGTRIVAYQALERHVTWVTVNFSLRTSCVSFARLQRGGSETEKNGGEGKSKARLPIDVEKGNNEQPSMKYLWYRATSQLGNQCEQDANGCHPAALMKPDIVRTRMSGTKKSVRSV